MGTPHEEGLGGVPEGGGPFQPCTEPGIPGLDIGPCQPEEGPDDLGWFGLGMLRRLLPEVPCQGTVPCPVPEIPQEHERDGLPVVLQFPGCLQRTVRRLDGPDREIVPGMVECDLHQGIRDPLLMTDLTIHPEGTLEMGEVPLLAATG